MIITNYADFRNIFGAGQPAADDGLPEWPVAKVLSITAPGTGIIKPFTSWQFNWPKRITAAAGIDAVIHVDEWHWYLLQPTETTAPRLELTRDDNLPVSTHSGSVLLSLTAAGLSAITTDGSPLYSAANVDKLFRGCYVYAYSIAGDSISIVDLHRCAFAAASI